MLYQRLQFKKNQKPTNKASICYEKTVGNKKNPISVISKFFNAFSQNICL